MSETIGFIGLGDLGQPIACNLLAAGYALKVYNRTASKAELLVALGAQQVFQPRDVLTHGGIVVSVVWDDAALESIVMSEGFSERKHKKRASYPYSWKVKRLLHFPRSYMNAPTRISSARRTTSLYSSIYCSPFTPYHSTIRLFATCGISYARMRRDFSPKETFRSVFSPRQ